MLSWTRYFKSINLFIRVIFNRFHLKPSIGNVAITVLIYDPISASHLDEGVFISLLFSIQLIDFVSGWSSPHNLGTFSLRPLEIISFVVGFPATPFDPSPKDVSSSSFVKEIAIFFSIPLSQQSSFYSFVPEALWCCSLHSSSRIVKIMFFPCLSHLTGVPCPLFKFFPFCQVLAPFSTGVSSEIVLTHCAILSIVPEAVYCWFHQVSSHLVKFLLTPSICSRSVVQIISFFSLLYLVSTGVLCLSFLF